MISQDICWADKDYAEKLHAMVFDGEYTVSEDDRLTRTAARPDASKWINEVTTFFKKQCGDLDVMEMDWTHNLKRRFQASVRIYSLLLFTCVFSRKRQNGAKNRRRANRFLRMT